MLHDAPDVPPSPSSAPPFPPPEPPFSMFAANQGQPSRARPDSPPPRNHGGLFLRTFVVMLILLLGIFLLFLKYKLPQPRGPAITLRGWVERYGCGPRPRCRARNQSLPESCGY